jgi:parallel beta-helix repeat protein
MFRALVEHLEPRRMLSVLTVGAGEQYATIQDAADVVRTGDTVDVEAGMYSGFVLGWNAPQSGTASAPIIFQAAPGTAAGSVIIDTRNYQTQDGIDLEAGCNFVTISGFTIQNGGSIARAGIRIAECNYVTISGNTVSGCGDWDIYTSHSNYTIIEDNIASDSISQHGVYVANSAVGTQVIDNTVFGNAQCGIQFNGDTSQGGTGVCTNCLIEGNTIYDNGAEGGAAINGDGLQNSTINQNTLYGNLHTGIALFQEDASAGPSGDIVASNTVTMANGALTAVEIEDAPSGGVNDFVGNTIFSGTVSLAPGTSTSIGVPSPPTKPAPTPQIFIEGAWQNTSITAETAPFQTSFSATPYQNDENVVIGLSNGPASTYADLAAIVRFNPSGQIDVRDGSNYQADNTVNYVAGSTYSFTMDVNPANQTYSVYVTPAGGSQIELASNYAFRTEQATTSTLNNLGDYALVGNAGVSGLVVVPLMVQPVAPVSSGAAGPTNTPDASNTGPRSGSVLTPYYGVLDTTANGQVIKDLAIQPGDGSAFGQINVFNDNVTIEDCTINGGEAGVAGGAAWIIKIMPGVTGTVIEDCSLTGTGDGEVCVTVCGNDTTISNCQFYNTAGSVFMLDASNITVKNNWLYEVGWDTAGTVNNGSVGDFHTDDVFLESGTGYVIENNVFDTPWQTTVNGVNYGDTTDFFIDPFASGDVVGTVAIQNNYLAGGGSYMFYCMGQGSVTFANNEIASGWHDGIVYPTYVGDPIIWANNVLQSTGQTLSAPVVSGTSLVTQPQPI